MIWKNTNQHRLSRTSALRLELEIPRLFHNSKIMRSVKLPYLYSSTVLGRTYRARPTQLGRILNKIPPSSLNHGHWLYHIVFRPLVCHVVCTQSGIPRPRQTTCHEFTSLTQHYQLSANSHQPLTTTRTKTLKFKISASSRAKVKSIMTTFLSSHETILNPNLQYWELTHTKIQDDHMNYKQAQALLYLPHSMIRILTNYESPLTPEGPSE